MRVLVIERDQALLMQLERQLDYAGLAVDAAVDGIDGYDKALSGRYDIVVVERDLDGLSGDEICWRLRTSRLPVRVLMLTSRTGVDGLVAGLELGADDYLIKPFPEAEFLARVRALGRRHLPDGPELLRCGDVELDRHSRQVRRHGQPVHLANKEFKLLETLLRAQGAVVSVRQILDEVWGSQTGKKPTAVRVTVRSLRIKLGSPPLIQTVIGAGYRAAEIPKPSPSTAGQHRTESALSAPAGVGVRNEEAGRVAETRLVSSRGGA